MRTSLLTEEESIKRFHEDGKTVNGLPPTKVSMRQARLALHQQGLLVSVESAISQLTASEKTVVEIEWEYAQEVDRSHEWVQNLTTALGLSDTQVDELFSLAGTL